MSRITRTAALAAVTSALALASAQLKPGDQPRSFQIPKSYAQQGQYLAALAKLEASKEELEKDPVEKTVYPYVHALLLANLGLQERALAEAFGPRIPDAEFAKTTIHPLDAARRRDALKAIGEQATHTQVVVLNEWHHVPQHRAFALQVAKELWKRGYRFLAAEALTDKDEIVANAPFVRAGIGYTADPFFGDFLRQAKRMGFKLVPYEAPTAELIKQKPEDRNAFRDSSQAKNIAKIFERDPQGKVFVYCGGDHVLETPTAVSGQTHTRMAGYLKQLTHIDPLTVDQMTEQYFNDVESQTPFRYAQRKGWVPRPTVFQTAPGKFWTGGPMASGVDMMVFHPAPSRRDGRPAWVAMDGYRQPFRLPAEARPKAGRLLATATVKGEPSDAVPMDLAILTPTETPALFLPRGEYVLRIQDEEGKTVFMRPIRQR
jgi:hypothetical protein